MNEQMDRRMKVRLLATSPLREGSPCLMWLGLWRNVRTIERRANSWNANGLGQRSQPVDDVGSG